MVLNKEFDIPSTNEILKVAVNRGTWKSKTPLQKWSYFYGIGRLLVCPLKLTTYQEDQTLSWFSYYSLFYCGLHAICVVCTGIHYILLGEPKNFLPCTCMFVGPVCGVCITFILWRSYHFQALISFSKPSDFAGCCDGSLK